SSTKALIFGTGGFLTANERMRITGSGSVGISSSSPSALFAISPLAGSPANILQIGSTTRTVIQLDSKYHFAFDGAASTTVSSCGAGPAVSGSDTSGTVTIGQATNACTITFANPYTNVPRCFANLRATAGTT